MELAAESNRLNAQSLKRLEFNGDRGSRYDTAIRELGTLVQNLLAPALARLEHRGSEDRQRLLTRVVQSLKGRARVGPAPRQVGVLDQALDRESQDLPSGSSAQMQHDLNRRTLDGRSVSVELDDTDNGYMGFLGYRFSQPFALELAYSDLRRPRSRIDAVTIDANLAADVLELHPIAGRSPSLSLLAFSIEYERRLSIFGKLGVWYWRSTAEVRLGGSVLENRENGWDLTGGIGAQFRLFDGVSARLEYERYFLDQKILRSGLHSRTQRAPNSNPGFLGTRCRTESAFPSSTIRW